MKVYVNPPKTPVTKGSSGIAAATVPNVCKMPGPPAPFVPAPLPNIGMSGDSPKGYSKKVKVHGKNVAIKGATFKSKGDVASKGTGGGLVSANTHGPTKFVGPGSLDVKMEGKAVQLLGDPMLNNCGGSGSPPNSATLVGVIQSAGLAAVFGDEDCPLCGEKHEAGGKLEESVDTQGECDKLQAAAKAAVAEATAERARLLEAMRLQKIKEITDAPAPKGMKAIRKRQSKLEKLEKVNDNWIKKAKIAAMLGVVKCKDCPKYYVGFSNNQYLEVHEQLPGGWHSPTAYDSLLSKATGKSIPTIDRFLPHVGNKDKFTELWAEGVEGNKNYNDPDHDLDESFNPPGKCAAQQTVLLALDHGCRPIGLTERWYKSEDETAMFEGDVYVRDLGPDDRPTPRRKAKKGEFGGKKAVPPCGTCQIILAALMCVDDRAPACDYRKPKPLVCKCTPPPPT